MPILSGFSTNRNKLRICVAFEYRGPKHPNSFHSSILLVPKSTGSSSSTTWKFHGTNALRPPDITGQTQIQDIIVNDNIPWRYESKETEVRTIRLQALMLLGKLSANIGISELDAILRDHVAVVQDDPSWNCNAWTTSAIEAFHEQGIIDIPISAQMIMGNGKKFAICTKLDYTVPVPTCDIYGQNIDSLVTTGLE
ncbi:hypothetical protein C8R42DRAFT_691309 [Lentinula raphanica]|nr:hypothetical protein C8R42DRAFT_691309 [Lentinula raphanica]